MTRNTTLRIRFEEWNGDWLAQVILDGILREELLPAPRRSHLRKTVAMVEEPDIALDHFRRLLCALSDQPGTTPVARLSQARLINICLWIMFVWAREAENVEAPYRASELALLEVWQLLKADIARTSKAGEAASLVLNELAELHFTIWDTLFEDKILPAAEIRHAISTAVESHAALDINLKLFRPHRPSGAARAVAGLAIVAGDGTGRPYQRLSQHLAAAALRRHPCHRHQDRHTD